MNKGELYFIKDEFYDKFSQYGLLQNKEITNGKMHNRPCCYLFKYDDSNIFWMIPVSSQITKYKDEYNKSINKYGKCDNISFGYILGNENAFLPQNMFPITEEYILNVYIDANTQKPITIPDKLITELNAKARKKIRYAMNGKKLGFSDITKIYNELTQKE